MSGGELWTQLTCERCGAQEEGTAQDLGGLGWGLAPNRQGQKVVRCPTCLARERRAHDREPQQGRSSASRHERLKREGLLGRRW